MKNKGYAKFGGRGGGGGQIRCIMADVQVAYERVLHNFSVIVSHIFNVLHSTTSACKSYYFASQDTLQFPQGKVCFKLFYFSFC